MDASPRDGSLNLDAPLQTFTTPRPIFSTPMTPPPSSPSSSSAKLSSAAAPPSEAPSTDDVGPSAPASSGSMSSFSRQTTDAGSSAGGDDDGRSVAATSATGDEAGLGGSSVALSTQGGGSSSSSSVATREEDSSVASGPAGGSTSSAGRPLVDLQLVEALTGKDRLYVLSVAQDMEGLFGNPSRASLSYSPSTSFHRRIVYQCAAYLGLQTGTGEAKAIVVRLPVELYALTSAPYRVVDIAPAPQPSTSVANQPPSGFKLMRRDPASSLPTSRGGSPGGDEVGEPSNRKKTYEQRQAEYDAARNKIFSAAAPVPSSSSPSDAVANGSSGGTSAEAKYASSSARANGALAAGRGLSAERRTGRSRASSHASSTDSVPVVFVEPPPSSSAAATAASAAGYIYTSSAQQRSHAPAFDPSLPPAPADSPSSAAYTSPVYPSVGHRAPAMAKSTSNGSGSHQGASSSSRGGGAYRPRNARPPASTTSQYGGSSSSRGGGGFQGYANQPRLYEPTSSRPPRQSAGAAGQSYGQASDWQVTPQPQPVMQPQPTMIPAQAFYQQHQHQQMAPPQAYMFVPFDGATGYVAQQPYGQQQQPSYGQPQQAAYAPQGSPYSSHSYPVTPNHPGQPMASPQHYLAAASAGQPAYYAQPTPQALQYGQYRVDGASSAPPFPHAHHHQAAQVQQQPQPQQQSQLVSYGPGGQPYPVYGVQSQVVVPQPQPYLADPSQQSWAAASASGGPSVYHRSDSSVSSFGEGSSRPQSRGSTSSRLSFGASSGMSNLRQPAWASDVGTAGSGSRQSWASTSNAGTTSGRSGRRRSSGAGTDRPSSPQSSTTSSVSRTRVLSQLAHIPPPKDHPLPPRPDWSVGHQQFDFKRPDGSSTRTPPRLTSTNDFPPLAGMGGPASSAPAPDVTSPKAGDGIWSGGRGRAAVLRATTSAPAPSSGGEPPAELLASPDRTLHGQPMQVAQAPAISVRSADVFLPHSLTEDDDDEDDDFEPRRPIARSSAALFDPSPAPSLSPRSNGAAASASADESALKDEERASIEDRLASINLGLSAGEGQGAAVIGPPSSAANGAGLTYSSIVRRA